ncbi:MAG TPA: MMPL family transporter [Puia sp.]|nr:MMPL family transporter [Puia sp.]
MWESIARFVLKNRWVLLVVLLVASSFMAYRASQEKIGYEFARAIPVDNPKYIEYQNFKNKFGDDGNTLLIAIQTDSLFLESVYNDYVDLNNRLKKSEGVEMALGVPSLVNFEKVEKPDSSETLKPVNIFPPGHLTQRQIDSSRKIFFSLPFYRGLVYNPETNTYLIALFVNRQLFNSSRRTEAVAAIVAAGDAFGAKDHIEMHYSGLPFIRTSMSDMIKKEMKVFLIGSLILSAIILMVFFRSLGTTVMSLLVVIMGVLWGLGTMNLLGYNISLLNALLPSLVVVIGIPNCIYFLNKYHTTYRETRNRETALYEMIRKMGIVTLFCNISAAIGFGVFALTRSPVLKEFGVVAGINIMLLFLISFVFIPAVLSLLPEPKPRHMVYLDNRWLLAILDRIEIWSLNNRKIVYGLTVLVVIGAVIGIFRLRSEGFIVDDLPRTDKIYTDLKFFEKNFKGVMPLEIVIDTKRKNGLRSNYLQTLQAIDSLSQYIAANPNMAKPLSIVEGLKFARQAYYEGDSSSYALPNQFDASVIAPLLSFKKDSSKSTKNNLTQLLRSFIDSTQEETRMSVNIADIGSRRLPGLLRMVQERSDQLFDSAKYRVQLTGGSVTFIEQSRFIINGLRSSILWAFVLIAICMLYLFKSFKILLCSLIPNTIPLIITAGVMGWKGIALKPSTVLIFSIALGIAIDITIRFLVNYKQELDYKEGDEQKTVVSTIHTTGISIIYTSLVLIAGFIIFCFSNFGGTQSLGWLTSLTLVLATLTNLIFLPALLISLSRRRKRAD